MVRVRLRLNGSATGIVINIANDATHEQLVASAIEGIGLTPDASQVEGIDTTKVRIYAAQGDELRSGAALQQDDVLYVALAGSPLRDAKLRRTGEGQPPEAAEAKLEKEPLLPTSGSVPTTPNVGGTISQPRAAVVAAAAPAGPAADAA